MNNEKERCRFKRIEERVVYTNKWIILYDDKVRRPDGQLGTYIRLTYHGNPRGAVIIPKHSDGRFLLLDIHRYAVDEFSLEFPRGSGSLSETIEEVALRELKDETSLLPVKLVLLGYLRPDSAILMTEVGVILADLGQYSEVNLILDKNEGISGANYYSLEEIAELAISGKIKDGFTLGALALLNAYELVGNR